MATSSTSPVKTKLYATVPVRPDYKVHLNAVRIDGDEYLDLREFIPSQNSEGRGILVNHEAVAWLLEEVTRYAKHYGIIQGYASGVHQEQGRLF